jgi:hypothetical protein
MWGPGAGVVSEGTSSDVAGDRSGSLVASYFAGVAEMGLVVLAFKDCPPENPERDQWVVDLLKCRCQ